MKDGKLKIIIINYRFFVSGGPERYLFNIIGLLEKKGHQVIPFSVKSSLNVKSEYEQFFISPVGKGEEVYFNEQKNDFKTVLKSFARMYYSVEAKKHLENLIEKVQPDLIYVLHYQNKISASIFDAAKKHGVPVVHRISDFGQICANALFFRPVQKDICERCLHGSKIHAVLNKCVHNSYIYSALKAGSLGVQKILNVESKIKGFVVPSKFTLQKLVEYGFPENKMHHIPTFFNQSSAISVNDISYKDFALYIGRIEEEKGLLTLVKAFVHTGKKLIIIGFSNTGFEDYLKKYLQDKTHNIEFLGRKNFDEIVPFLEKCAFTIVPSEWYDNFPNTVLESYAFKKAVIATNVGSLKEMIIDKQTGLLFNLTDFNDLAEKSNYLFSDPDLCKTYGESGYKKLAEEYSSEIHYNKLIEVFNNALA